MPRMPLHGVSCHGVSRTSSGASYKIKENIKVIRLTNGTYSFFQIKRGEVELSLQVEKIMRILSVSD